MPPNKAKPTPEDGKPSHKRSEEEVWREREKRLKELLEKDGGPNPRTKEDFDKLLKEMARSSE